MSKKMDIYAELNDFVEENEGQVTLTDVAKHFAEYGYQYALQHPQWIPVEERKPQGNQRVRAWSLENNEEYLCDYHDGIFEDFYGSFTDGKITHWMPIVPPRKEE